jgi:hypothetical protein
VGNIPLFGDVPERHRGNEGRETKSERWGMKLDKHTKVSNLKVDYHRNGIGGNGFYVALFDMKEGCEEVRKMVGVVFPEAGTVAVFDLKMLAEGNIEFANGNSWRGDMFEPELREAIAKHEIKEIARIDAILAKRGQHDTKK